MAMDRYGHLYPEARSEISNAFETAFTSVTEMRA